MISVTRLGVDAGDDRAIEAALQHDVRKRADSGERNAPDQELPPLFRGELEQGEEVEDHNDRRADLEQDVPDHESASKDGSAGEGHLAHGSAPAEGRAERYTLSRRRSRERTSTGDASARRTTAAHRVVAGAGGQGGEFVDVAGPHRDHLHGCIDAQAENHASDLEDGHPGLSSRFRWLRVEGVAEIDDGKHHTAKVDDTLDQLWRSWQGRHFLGPHDFANLQHVDPVHPAPRLEAGEIDRGLGSGRADARIFRQVPTPVPRSRQR